MCLLGIRDVTLLLATQSQSCSYQTQRSSRLQHWEVVNGKRVCSLSRGVDMGLLSRKLSFIGFLQFFWEQDLLGNPWTFENLERPDELETLKSGRGTPTTLLRAEWARNK